MNRLRRHRWLLAAGLVLVAFVAVALVLPTPSTPDGPYGTSILRRLLEVRGVSVTFEDRPVQSQEIFFLAHDLRTAEQAREILDWVRSGGRVVVADPASPVLAEAGLHPMAVSVGGLFPEQELSADCALASSAGVGRIVTSSTDAVFQPAERVVGCFAAGGGHFLAERRYGQGTVVGLGGLTPLTNVLLGEEDDVVLAWNLLGASGDPVVFGSALPAGTGPPPGLWELLPDPARVIIVQAVLVLVLFAAARGRRLGKPAEEDLPSPIPATQLVLAGGELYRRSRAAGHASTVLRQRFRTRAARRLGLDPGAGDGRLVRAVSEETGVSEGEVAEALFGRVIGEQGLVTVARDLHGLERRMEGRSDGG